MKISVKESFMIYDETRRLACSFLTGDVITPIEPYANNKPVQVRTSWNYNASYEKILELPRNKLLIEVKP
jgi:hypothetical protein